VRHLMQFESLTALGALLAWPLAARRTPFA
jgi:hypothetical protein